MIVDDYKVKIVDFGLSKSVNGHVHLPQTDENIAGTVAYMVVNFPHFESLIGISMNCSYFG